MASKQTSSPTSLSIGGATFDVFLTFANGEKHEEKIILTAGKKIKISSVVEACGGGACNTSVGLARLGIKASFCGVVGSDQWGERLLETMKAEGVSTSSATIVDDETSSFSIILSLLNGDRTILYAPGVNEHLHDSTFDMDAIKKSNIVYLNHLSDTSCMIEDNIIDAILKEKNVHLTWNPGGCQIEGGMEAKHKPELLKITNLLLLNKEEALAFTGMKTIDDAMQKLVKAGVKNVVITDGKNGTTATDGKKIYHCPILKDTKVVDTTGAGDAFGSAATWALAVGESLPIALISGTLNAASVVGAYGAQAGLLTETHMRDWLNRNLVNVSERS